MIHRGSWEWTPPPALEERLRAEWENAAERGDAARLVVLRGALDLAGFGADWADPLARDWPADEAGFRSLVGAVSDAACRAADLIRAIHLWDLRDDTQSVALRDLADSVEAALRWRHDLECARIAGEGRFWVVCSGDLTGIANDAVEEFELAVRPELWRLARFNDRRLVHALELAPWHRARCWWWTLGVELPPVEDALDVVARLIADFPDARSHLDRLVRAARIERGREVVQAGPGMRRRTEAAMTLGRWLTGVPAANDTVALVAGFSAGETPVLELAEVEVAFRAPNVLVVDVVADLAPGCGVVLRAGDATVALHAVEGTEQRFEACLSASVLGCGAAELIVGLSTGSLSVALPPRE